MKPRLSLQPLNPDYETFVRESFARQKTMVTFGARLVRVAPGESDIEMPFREDLTQHHGFLHAGVVTTIVDNACGFAAMSLMPVNAGVLTVEYKVNFIRPATGKMMIARGRVIEPGQEITICSGDVVAVVDGQEQLVATMLATMMTVHDR